MSRNEMLEAEFAAERDRARNHPPSAALGAIEQALHGDESDEQREARIAAYWVKRSSYWCAGCQYVFGDGEVIYRKRKHEFYSSSWEHRAFCAECVQKWHPSWWAWRGEPHACPGGCGALFSFWLSDHVVACSRRCTEIVQRERRHVMYEPRACVVCGETFTPTRADARYCSNAHRQRAYRERGRT